MNLDQELDRLGNSRTVNTKSKLKQVFREWALDLIGPNHTISDQFYMGVTVTKNTIRQRIMEATK